MMPFDDEIDRVPVTCGRFGEQGGFK